ncbi:tetratricopeptide-like protein [Beauveria bassiana ARSEF 2860]|uniref:Tetratricopeptide-like protein n=1 Tax=Beauveria bassiana (strain ARSEF 2860) TaxID=655819 RepID=J4KLB5_BEAB2|nr:tetratricopeptide-like protein [Beauveria bassiana ARSEF 2860]EJP61914.1 tetratricopeptide-like protein [Beauveria bassiana ARSEF 2860]
MLDLKHASIAKALILFNMMHEIDKEMTTKGPHPTDYFLVMAYVFACQIIPPFVQKKLQSNIQDLIERLENKKEPLSFIHLHACDTEAVIRILRQWQNPWPAISKPAHVRKFIEEKTPPPNPLAPDKGPDGPEKKDFRKFAALFPSQALARQWEPSLADTLAEYKKTGKGKKLLQQIDATWAVNNTLIDYDVADYELEIPGGSCAYLEFDPLEMVSAADFASKSGERAKAKTNNSIDRLADVFRVITISTMKLHSQKRLIVEMIVGEMTDIMERIRYNALEHRRPDPKNSKTDEPLDPTKFPQTYDYIHMSNIPDYIGGHLTTFLVARPLLNDKSLSSLRFNNLLNSPEFENHEAFQSEYLLMHDEEHIKSHFSVRRRPGASIADNPIFKSMFAGKISSFAFEGDMIWD